MLVEVSLLVLGAGIGAAALHTHSVGLQQANAELKAIISGLADRVKSLEELIQAKLQRKEPPAPPPVG